MKKFVYSFNEGSKNMRELLGGKGANLAEMTRIGLPVPFGFTVTTEACNRYYEDEEELEEEIGMTPVLWSLDSLDWKLKDTGKIIRQVLKDVKDGDIILLHDIFPSSVEAALELIDILQKEGYVFVTADELLIE